MPTWILVVLVGLIVGYFLSPFLGVILVLIGIFLLLSPYARQG
jgi:uncharacterized membrane protein (Fun14 family)